MRSHRWSAVSAALLGSLLCASAADARPVTRADVTRLAAIAPEPSAARARAAGFRAGAKRAGTLSLQNPEIYGQAGPRLGDGAAQLAVNAGVAIPVDIFGQRGARIEAAEAEADAAVAGARRATIAPLREALALHAEALATRARGEVFAARLKLVEELHVASTRRRQAGEVAENEVALVRLQVARERAAAAQLDGEARSLENRLAAALGLPEGETAEATGPLVPTESLLGQAPLAPTIAAAEADRAAARARLEREEAAGRPTIALLGSYELDGGAHILTGGVAIPLPFYGVNDAEVAVARGQAAAADLEVVAARRQVSAQQASLRVRVEATGRALEAMRPAAAEAREIVGRAQRAYTGGESDLPTLLLTRREALEAELGVIDAELAHALARIDLLLAQGRWSR